MGVRLLSHPQLGDHDASGPAEETQWWFRKWIDPPGETKLELRHAFAI
jgi:hypothetical protein